MGPPGDRARVALPLTLHARGAGRPHPSAPPTTAFSPARPRSHPWPWRALPPHRPAIAILLDHVAIHRCRAVSRWLASTPGSGSSSVLATVPTTTRWSASGRRWKRRWPTSDGDHGGSGGSGPSLRSTVTSSRSGVPRPSGRPGCPRV